MQRWLLSGTIFAVAAPAALLVVAVHQNQPDEAARAALGDILVDAPETPFGQPSPSDMVHALDAQPEIGQTSPILAGPVLLSQGSQRRALRLVGIEPTARRLHQLASLRDVSSRPNSAKSILSPHGGTIILPTAVAAALKLGPGDPVEATALAAGPAALGLRSRHYRLGPTIDSGLVGFDSATALVTLEDAKQLFGSRASHNGVVAWFHPWATTDDWRPPAPWPKDQRVRLRPKRDWTVIDGVGLRAMAQSTLLLVFVVGLLALPLARFPKEMSYSHLLEKAAPAAGGALLAGTMVAVALVLIGQEEPLRHTALLREDLGRLLLAGGLGLLLSPLVVPWFSPRVAAAALAGITALALSEPLATALAAGQASRQAPAQEVAARLHAQGTTTVVALASRGAEVIPLSLLGLDPTRPESTRLVGRLCRRQVALRPDGGTNSPAWAQAATFGSLLDHLAETGAPSTTPPSARVRPIILGSAAAQRLGASEGDELTLSVVPPAAHETGAERPWPVQFRLAAVAEVGHHEVDLHLGLVDARHLEAFDSLANREEHLGPLAFSSPDRQEAASRPWDLRILPLSLTATCQVVFVAFLLGGVLRAGRRGFARAILLPTVGGIGAGMLLAWGEASRGALEQGDSAWYAFGAAGPFHGADLLCGEAWLPALAVAGAGSLAYAVHGLWRRRLVTTAPR